MKLAVDTETAPILPGLKAPPLVCFSFAYRQGAEAVSYVKDRFDGMRHFIEALLNPDIEIVGQNFAYDAVVIIAEAQRQGLEEDLLRAFFAAYDAGRIHDVMINEKLKDLAKGQLGYRGRGYYTLEALAKRYCDMELEKNEWRLRYGLLLHVPLSDWPHGAIEYARLDGLSTLLVEEKQDEYPDAISQIQAAFALQLISSWGMRTDAEYVDKLERRLTGLCASFLAELKQHRLIRENGTQDMLATKALVEQCWPRDLGPIPATTKYEDWDAWGDGGDMPTEGVSTASDILHRCKHPALQTLVEFKKARKILTTYLPALHQGTTYPICTTFSELQANGRISSRKPNLLNPPRSGGVRECFIPRPGNVFVDGDFDTLEIRTFAQTLKMLVGGTTLTTAFQRDRNFDQHTNLAAQIMGITYEQGLQLKNAKDPAFLKLRQDAKPGNFGFAGSMGIPRFREYAYKSTEGKVDLSDPAARALRQHWFNTVPEARPYFDWCGRMTERGFATINQLVSGRIRGGCSYTDLANGCWSALANDGTKTALYEIVKRCYIHPGSALYGSRVALYVYDQYILEAPEDGAPEVAEELSQVACEVMQRYTPDVPITMAAALTRRWYKGADPVYENGRLVPWEPKPKRVAA